MEFDLEDHLQTGDVESISGMASTSCRVFCKVVPLYMIYITSAQALVMSS